MYMTDYVLPEELYYMKYVASGVPVFAPGELHKVQNYDIAHEQGFYGWHLHHRRGYIRKESTGMPRNDLILNNLYYARPADELVFLTQEDHLKAHKGIPVSLEYGDALNGLYLEKLEDYRELLRSINNTIPLTPEERNFVVEFCHRTGRDLPGIPTSGAFRCVSMTSRRYQLARRLVVKGIGDLPTRLQQQEMLVQFLKDIGEYTYSTQRAIERILKDMPTMMGGNALQSYTPEERKTLCHNAVADIRKATARERASGILKKFCSGVELTPAERVFKSRHKDLFNVLHHYSDADRHTIYSTAQTQRRMEKTLQRVRAVAEKIARGEKLTATERTFKSRHRGLFLQEDLPDMGQV